uniref:C2H2-type domain-containing protein n=1 Tax=Musca domestica TaxID=7370 RepID=A0A1I8N0J2_MUSDO
MLKAIGQLPTYENVKCGEIFCVSSPPAVFNVTCILCDQKISLDKYALHFESQHLTLAEESYSLQDLVTNSRSCDVVEIKFEEDPPDDPIKEELSKGNLVEVPALQSICDREASDNEEFLDEDRSLLEILHESKKSHEQKVTKKRRCDKLPKQEVNSSLETSSQLVELSISLAVDNTNNELDISKNISDDDGNGDDDNDDDDDDDWLEKRDKKAKTRSEESSNDSDIELPHPCLICQRSYRSKQSLEKHNRLVHNPNGAAVKRKRKRSSKKPADEYKCNECDKVFRSEREMGAHRFQHTGIFCDICGKTFTQVGNMRRHRMRHDGIKAHKCRECSKDFFTKKELLSHMICHTGLMPWICEICGKRCRDRGVLTAHMRRHTGERPAKCNVCMKSFFSFHDLNVHAVAHTNERPFKCDICSATFQRKKALRIHKRIHTEARKHICQICGKAFAQAGSLKTHMIRHGTAMEKTENVIANKEIQESAVIVVKNDGANDVATMSAGLLSKAKTTEQRSCEICHRQYTSLKNYNKHMYYSHNIKLYSRKVNYKYHCDGCEKAFRTPRDLRAHTLKCNHNVKSDSNYGGEAKQEEVEEDNFNTTEEFQNSIDNEAVVQDGEENPLEMLNQNPENNKEEEEQSKPTAKTGKHTQQHQQQNELSCHICNRKYTTIKLHNKHMFAAHQIKILSRKVNYKHKCDECDQVFRIERDLRAHKVKHQKELENASSIITMLPNSEHKERKRGFRSAMSTTETVQMEVMGMMPMPKDDGVANKQVHHNDNQSAVEDNDGAEEDTDWLDDSLVENEPNLEISDSKEVLSCRICRRTFKALKFLNKHMSLRHKIKVLSRKVNYKYKCDECEQMFRTQRDLKGHKVREHLGISCDICGKMFAQAGNMRRHRVRHSGIKAFKCKECPKEFYTSKELKSHTICHTGILPYICEICGRRCRDGGDLSAHMRRHTGERPAKCDVCGKRFFSVHDLNTHSVMHTTERPFSCEICGSRFQLKKTLRVHKLIHLPPQFSCNICDKTFVQSGHLRIHMRRHGNLQEKTNNSEESKNESNPEELYVPTVFEGSPDNVVNVMPNAQGV